MLPSRLSVRFCLFDGFLSCLVILGVVAHTEDWDTKRLLGTLLGWAASAVVSGSSVTWKLEGREGPEAQ